MGVPAKRMRLMDDEQLFNLYYVEMGVAGSANKIREDMRKKRLINPRTGNPPTTSAIWQAINRYIARNYQNPEVRRIVNKYYIDCGSAPLNDEEWLELVSRHARTSFGPLQYRNWVRQHPDLPDFSRD